MATSNFWGWLLTKFGPVSVAANICVQFRHIPINKHYPFSWSLSRHPPGPTTIHSSSALPSYAYKATSARVLRTRLLEKLLTIKSTVSATLVKQQQRYKRDFETEVGSILKFRRGRLVYMDSTPLTTAAEERTKPQAYKKLISRTQGLYHVIDVSLHTINIDENGILNTISIRWATPSHPPGSTRRIIAIKLSRR